MGSGSLHGDVAVVLFTMYGFYLRLRRTRKGEEKK